MSCRGAVPDILCNRCERLRYPPIGYRYLVSNDAATKGTPPMSLLEFYVQGPPTNCAPSPRYHFLFSLPGFAPHLPQAKHGRYCRRSKSSIQLNCLLLIGTRANPAICHMDPVPPLNAKQLLCLKLLAFSSVNRGTVSLNPPPQPNPTQAINYSHGQPHHQH